MSVIPSLGNNYAFEAAPIISAENYYKAMANKDISGVAQYLHPNVRFTAPLAERVGKEAVLESVQ